MVGKRKRFGLQTYGVDAGYNMGIINSMRQKYAEANADLIIFLGTPTSLSEYSYQQFSVSHLISDANIDVLISSVGTICSAEDYETVLGRYPRLTELPVICLSADVPDKPSIILDNRTGITELVQHLVEKHKCKTFAIITGSITNTDSNERLEVIRETLRTYDIDVPDSHVYNGSFITASGVGAMTHFMNHGILPVDAVLCLNDSTAFGVVKFCQNHSILIPDDIIVTGFDNLPRSSCIDPPLTTVMQDFTEMGNKAADFALALAEKKEVPRLSVINCTPVYRQSCGCISKTDITTNYIRQDGSTVSYTTIKDRMFGEAYLNLEDEMFQFQRYINELGKINSLAHIQQPVMTALQYLDIKSAVLVLYEERQYFHCEDDTKLPHKAFIPMAYDETGVKNYEGYTFNPNDILMPEGILSDRQRTLAVKMIYYTEIQFGYIVYEIGSMNSVIYDTFLTELSNIINTAWLYDDRQQAEHQITLTLRQLESHSQYLDTLSNTDEMTGLFNRRGFVLIGQQYIDLSITSNKPCMVIFADMDGLKKINDTYGHQNGDIAIKGMATVLKSLFRESDIVARMGGDEFAVIAIGQTTAFLPTLRKRMQDAIDKWNDIHDYPFTLSVSFGARDITSEKSALYELLDDADSSLYKEKRRKNVARD